ncbi:MAG TPA: xanthine dehydrogenase family protein molybdopterin-binding subunit [Anaerolineales bacterium]|nr:xanthine dehydrogenase family protein molybdopterin-binding subunit [Anaerolineales bacterium]HNB34885.1 xanthine dehydrogenase family protein molybdopterin-binding subunit [Anaerolineales bacterium]HNC07146.1 xanthine dehydrogenase family protein molybdopterin-binding subunit [Anaerolineales bacterium]
MSKLNDTSDNPMSNKSIGTSQLRVDARGKVTGATQYSGDRSMSDMLHMKILMAERPYARVKKINTKSALASPGIVAVYTAQDVPVNEYGLQIPDQPVLCGPGASKPYSDIVRFVGDQIAVVVAETEVQAAAAMKLIEVDYEDLPPLTDPVTAMQPGAPILHPDRGDTNVCVHYKIRKGNVDEGFAQADVIVEGEYQTPVQEHAFLQPEAGLAYLDEEGRITVESAGQWTHADRETIAHALNIPNEQVRIIYPAIGGAFGGREDLSVQIVLALAAMKLKRPVKIVWSRRESMIGHGKRHAVLLRAKWGATRDGKLVAIENEIIGDGGAYMYTTNKVLGNATITSSGPYFVPNIKTDVYGVYTNNVPGAAFRGFGAPQALFMAEGQMNKLAEKLGMDPVEIRLKNALRQGDTLGVGTPAPNPVSIVECIEAARDSYKWKKIIKRKSTDKKLTTLVRGRGFACGFKNVGFSFGYKENCWAKIEIHGKTEIERVILHHAGAEVGQGFQTVMSQIAAEVLKVSPSLIEFRSSDSATQGNPGSASASRLTFMAGNSVRGAAQAAIEKWGAEERPAIAEFSYFAPPTTPMNKETGYSMPNFQYAYVAQVIDVEVDTETGHVRVKRVVSADDVGKAINPDLVVGQIEGAIVQAHGYAVMEEFKTRDGRVLTDQFSTYLLPTIWDIPEKVESVIVEVPDPNGPWGARGMGELPYLPVAAAVAAAIHDATGVWMNEFPFTPERVLRALGKIK